MSGAIPGLGGVGAFMQSDMRLKFIASASGTGGTANLSSLAEAGDFCFLMARASLSRPNSSPPSDVTPSGFTEFGTKTYSQIQPGNESNPYYSTARTSAFGKLLMGNETTVSVLSGAWLAMTFRLSGSVAGFDGDAWKVGTTNSYQGTSAQPVDASGLTGPLLVCGGLLDDGTVSVSDGLEEIISGGHRGHYALVDAGKSGPNIATYGKGKGAALGVVTFTTA